MESSDQVAQLQRRLRLLSILLIAMFVMFVWPTLRWWLGFGIVGTPRAITPRGDLANFEKTTTELFKSASPSVVYLNTRSRVANPFSRRGFEIEAGAGSGFVWDEAGHVVTNFHVIQNATSATVVMYDQTAYRASAVGVSPDHDIAVLRIHAPAAKLRPLAIGESADLLVGQAVFAIGNPFGLSHTLTTGIVSAKSRTITSPSNDKIDEVIQIDAAINPGNSGGPLLDSAGRLVGVNTAIFSPSGASAGVGFAIPVDTVNRVVPQIIAKGKYERPQLGITVNSEINAAVTARLNQPGVLILDVEPSGAAAAAGLRGTTGDETNVKIGDLIQKVDGREVASVDDLFQILEECQVGQAVEVEFLRDGQSQSTVVELQ